MSTYLHQHAYLPISRYLLTCDNLPTYVNLPTPTNLHQHTYLPISTHLLTCLLTNTYQHMSTYHHLPTYLPVPFPKYQCIIAADPGAGIGLVISYNRIDTKWTLTDDGWRNAAKVFECRNHCLHVQASFPNWFSVILNYQNLCLIWIRQMVQPFNWKIEIMKKYFMNITPTVTDIKYYCL